MTCPHCKYEHGYVDGEEIGNKGHFYKTKLKRTKKTVEEFKTLYACPNCGKTFINV